MSVAEVKRYKDLPATIRQRKALKSLRSSFLVAALTCVDFLCLRSLTTLSLSILSPCAVKHLIMNLERVLDKG